MSQSVNDLIICESASVRLGNGDIFEFPIVDNKNLFVNFFKTKSEFNVEIKSLYLDRIIHAMYKRHKDIAYLVCSWEIKEELNEEAIFEIKSNPRLAYLLN